MAHLITSNRHGDDEPLYLAPEKQTEHLLSRLLAEKFGNSTTDLKDTLISGHVSTHFAARIRQIPAKAMVQEMTSTETKNFLRSFRSLSLFDEVPFSLNIDTTPRDGALEAVLHMVPTEDKRPEVQSRRRKDDEWLSPITSHRWVSQTKQGLVDDGLATYECEKANSETVEFIRFWKQIYGEISNEQELLRRMKERKYKPQSSDEIIPWEDIEDVLKTLCNKFVLEEMRLYHSISGTRQSDMYESYYTNMATRDELNSRHVPRQPSVETEETKEVANRIMNEAFLLEEANEKHRQTVADIESKRKKNEFIKHLNEIKSKELLQTKSQLEQIMVDIKGKIDELSRNSVQLEELEKGINVLTEEYNQLNHENLEKKKELKSLLNESSALSKEKVQLSSSTVARMNKMKQSFLAEKKQIEEKIQLSDTHIQEEEQKLKDLEAELAELQSELHPTNEMTQLRKLFEVSSMELEEINSKIAAGECAMAKKEGILAELKRENAELAKEYEIVSLNLAKEQKTVRSMEEKFKELQEIQQTLLLEEGSNQESILDELDIR